MVVACGARSPLRIDDKDAPRAPDAGSDGQGAGFDASPGDASGGYAQDAPIGDVPAHDAPIPWDAPGEAGSGGAPGLTCKVTGEPVHFEGAYTADEVEPHLVSTSDDGIKTTLVARCESGVAPTVHALSQLTFEPWGDWPNPTLTQATYFTMTEALPSRFGVAPGASGGFALLAALKTEGQPDGTVFDPVISTAPPDMFVDGATLLSPVPMPGLFAVRGPGDYLVGVEDTDAGFAVGRALRLAESGQPVGPAMTLGCSASAVSADAVATSSGYLVAYSSSAAFADPCGSAPGEPDVPNAIHVVELSGAGATGLFSVFGNPVTSVRVIGWGDSAWLVWHGGTPSTYHPVRAIAIDGGSPSPAVELSSPTATAFATAALGHQLLVVWLDAEKPDTLLVRVVHQLDALAPPIEVSFSGVSFGAGDMTVIPSPDQAAFVVAWSAVPPGGTDTHERIHVARFGCTPW